VSEDWSLEKVRDSVAGRYFFHRLRYWLSNGWQNGNINLRDLYCTHDPAIVVTNAQLGAAVDNWTLVNANAPYDPQSPILDFQAAIVAIQETQWRSTDGDVTFTSIGNDWSRPNA
jgi:hypothetical protein